MAQVSGRKIDERDWERMWEKLVYAVGTNRSVEAAGLLLGGLLTSTERVMMTKRLMAMLLLISGWEVVVVAERLKLSTATVYKIKTRLEIDRRLRELLLTMFPKKIEYDVNEIEEMKFLDRVDVVFEEMKERRRRKKGLFGK